MYLRYEKVMAWVNKDCLVSVAGVSAVSLLQNDTVNTVWSIFQRISASSYSALISPTK